MSKKQSNKKEKKKQPNVQVIVHKYPSFIEWVINSISQFKDWATNISSKKSTLLISLLMLVVAVLIYSPSRTDDYDIWYHLKFGEHFVKNLTFKLDHSIFSWTPADPNWRYGIWLGSSILYIAYKMFSVYGLYIIQWLIFTSIFLLYWKFVRVIGDSLDINHIMSLMLVFIALNLTAIYIKPELFTTLFFTVAVFIYFYTKFTFRNLFYVYPPLLFIWVNTHGGYLTGLMFVSLVLAGETFNFLFVKRNHLEGRLLKHLAISVAASYIAVIFNPYGIDYHIGIIKSLITKEYMSVATQVYAWIDMWRYIFPKDDFAFRFFNTGWSLVIMVISFFTLSIYIYAKKRFFDLTLLLLNGVFFYLGMKNARVTLFLPLIWMFSMLYILKKADSLNIKKKFSPVALVLVFLMAIYTTDLTIINLEDRSWFGSNIISYAPVKEVEFIKKNKLPGPIFNDYLIGGYLIWAMYPDYKVFIDPRYGPYWRQVGPDYFELIRNMNAENLKKFTSKYPFKIALLHMRERNLIFLFLSSPDWKLLYFYKTAVVIIHKSVIPSLSKETLSTDMGTQRFRDVANPIILEDLFRFYLQVGPVYAREILDIYKNNVSTFFRYKTLKIQEMQNLINQRELQLQQQQIQKQL
jgi:hypothetical protein